MGKVCQHMFGSIFLYLDWLVLFSDQDDNLQGDISFVYIYHLVLALGEVLVLVSALGVVLVLALGEVLVLALGVVLVLVLVLVSVLVVVLVLVFD